MAPKTPAAADSSGEPPAAADAPPRAVLTERIDVAGLREAIDKLRPRVQGIAVRLCDRAEQGSVTTTYKKPSGGGRAVAEGCSGQKLWKILRKAGFFGYCSYDIAGSHLALANALTGGTMTAIRDLVQHYEKKLQELTEACGGDRGPGRVASKAFFLTMLNGGSVRAWRLKFGIAEGCKLTPLARRFLAQAKELRKRVAESIPEAAEAARRRGKSPLTLCLYEAEDRTLQVFESVAKRHGAEVGLLMFDEVLVWKGDHSEASLIALGEEATREASARWGAPVRFVYSADA